MAQWRKALRKKPVNPNLNTIIFFVLLGAGAGLFTGLMEVLRLMTVVRQYFIDILEARLASLYALFIAAAGGLIAGIFIAFFMIVIRPLARRLPYHSAAVAVFVLSWPTCASLTSGPRACAISGRWIWVTLASLAAGAAAVVFLWAVVKLSKMSFRFRAASAAVFLAVSVLLYHADLIVLPRLYPVFHAWLSILSIFSASLAFYFLFKTKVSSLRMKGALITAALGIFLVTAGAYVAVRVRDTFNMQMVLREHTAVVSHIMHAVDFMLPQSAEDSDYAAAAQEESAVPGVHDSTRVQLPLLPSADIIFITIDALRPDHMGLYGYGRPTTPNIDRLGKDAVVFNRAYCSTPHSSYSITSFQIGKYLRGIADIPSVPFRHQTWPEVMAEVRYQTAAFFTPSIFYVDRNRFNVYLKDGFGYRFRKVDYFIPATDRVDQAIRFLDQAGKDRPVFVWIHFFEPHEPYEPRLGARFGDTDVDRYDAEIAEVDEAVARLIDYVQLERPDSIVIFAADHGEAFGEHSSRYHGTTLYEEQIRVPLFIRIPGIKPRRIDEPVELVDLMGTALALTGVPMPARIRSDDLRPLIAGAVSDYKPAAYTETGDMEAVIEKRYKLICSGGGALCRLYDLEDDPGELKNMADSKPQVVRKLYTRLKRWRRSLSEYELRPVVAEDGKEHSWPPEIQAAIRGEEGAAGGLAVLLASDAPPQHRIKAAQILISMDVPVDQNLISTAMDDGNESVAAWAAVAACSSADCSSAEVVSRLLAGSDSELALAAAVALGRAGDSRSLGTLRRILEDAQADFNDRVTAAVVMGNLKDRESVPHLIRSLEYLRLRPWVTQALAGIGDKRAVGPIIEYLEKERFEKNRVRMIKALKQLNDPAAIPCLERLAASDKPPEGVDEALEKLRSR